MSFTATLALLWLASDPRASRVDVSGGATIEIRGGRAPLSSNTRPRPALLTILAPNVAMESAFRRGGGQLTLGYSPVAQYRAPNRLGLDRPLLLHQIFTSYAQDLTPRWVLGVNLSGSVGETDYTGLAAVLDDNAQTVDARVTQFFLSSASASLVGAVSRRVSVTMQPRVTYRTPTGTSTIRMPMTMDGDEDEPVTLPDQLGAAMLFGVTTRVSSRDDITAAITPSYVSFRGGDTRYVAATNMASWLHRYRPALSTTVDLGTFSARSLGDQGSWQIFPVGGASVRGDLSRSSSHHVSGNFGGRVGGFFDRVTGQSSPRASLTSGLTVDLPPRWAVRVAAAAVTNVTGTPRSGGTVAESAFNFSTPITYTIDDRQSFEFGTVVTARAPHLAADRFRVFQLETWLYVAYRIGAGTARGGEEVTSSSGPIGRTTRSGASQRTSGRSRSSRDNGGR